MSINSPRTTRNSRSLFRRTVDRTLELELWDAWVFAAGDATRALRGWELVRGSDDAAAAYVAYRAALDREERAADVLAECAAERARLRKRALVAA
ncbi:hypothetical protein VSS74_10585 [Conexibacter stalactiti]|uniref:Uncharacterized protein n=1 Tax=Conexibacter stalactiti TaxID=1940611 RepID=A0ABU4HN93_9ACTN|nr:hypothetical protein [Conexibacter stalactiti]MDW5594786.1 hypothetical protein [Conexibacter stalactiti]MEC5035428.1 hypothetical protein [Conexibacter stalactiti]